MICNRVSACAVVSWVLCWGESNSIKGQLSHSRSPLSLINFLSFHRLHPYTQFQLLYHLYSSLLSCLLFTMSLLSPPNVSSLATPAVNDEDQHSVVSEVFDANTNSNESENGSSGTTTNPSSPEATQSLNIDQPQQTVVLAEDPFDSEASRALFDAIDQFQSCGTGNFDATTPQVLTSRSFPWYRCSALAYKPLACGCRSAVCWKILSAPELDGCPLPSWNRLLHTFRNSYRLQPDGARHPEQG